MGLPSLSLLVVSLSGTVAFAFGFHSASRTPWLEAGANRLPTKFEQRLIPFMSMMAWALVFEAGAVAITMWLHRAVS